MTVAGLLKRFVLFWVNVEQGYKEQTKSHHVPVKTYTHIFMHADSTDSISTCFELFFQLLPVWDRHSGSFGSHVLIWPDVLLVAALLIFPGLGPAQSYVPVLSSV